jgi:hypothetical protein
MRKLFAGLIAFALLSALTPMTVEAKKKKFGVKVRFESILEMPEGLRPATEMTTMSMAELTEAGYTQTGTVIVQTVIRQCTYQADGTEKCKNPKKLPDSDAAVLAEVANQGGGLVLKETFPNELRRDVMGKICVSYRPDRGGLAECSDWRQAKTGYEIVQVVKCTVWNQLP